MNIKTGGSSVTINGKNYRGNSVSVYNGKVIVDGVQQEGDVEKDVVVVVHGDCESIELECGKLTVGNVGSVNTQSGDIECKDVSGSIQTMSGDIDCGSVGGSISTMSGDVKHRS